MSRFVCVIWSAGCRRISLGAICQTARDRTGDFRDAKRKGFSRQINKVVQGSEHDLLYINFIWQHVVYLP